MKYQKQIKELHSNITALQYSSIHLGCYYHDNNTIIDWYNLDKQRFIYTKKNPKILGDINSTQLADKKFT